MPSVNRHQRRPPSESEVRAANTTFHHFVGSRQYDWMTPGQAPTRPLPPKTRPDLPHPALSDATCPASSTGSSSLAPPPASRATDTTLHPSAPSAAAPVAPTNLLLTAPGLRPQQPPLPPACRPPASSQPTTVASQAPLVLGRHPLAQPASAPENFIVRPIPTVDNDMPPRAVLPPHQTVLPSPTPSNDDPSSAPSRSLALPSSSAPVSSQQSSLSIYPVPHSHGDASLAASLANGMVIQSPANGLPLHTPFASNPTNPATERGQTHTAYLPNGRAGLQRPFDPVTLGTPSIADLELRASNDTGMMNFIRLLKDALVPPSTYGQFIPDLCFSLIVQIRDFARLPHGLPQQAHNIPHFCEALQVLDTCVFSTFFPLDIFHDFISPKLPSNLSNPAQQQSALKIFDQVRTCLEALGSEYSRISKWVREDRSGFVFEDLIITFRIPSRILRRELTSAFLASTYPVAWASPVVRSQVTQILAQNEMEYYRRANEGHEATGRTGDVAVNHYRSRLRALLNGNVPTQNFVPVHPGPVLLVNGPLTGPTNGIVGQIGPNPATQRSQQQQELVRRFSDVPGQQILSASVSAVTNTGGGGLPRRQTHPAAMIPHTQGQLPSLTSGQPQSIRDVRGQVVPQPPGQVQPTRTSAPLANSPAQASGAFWVRPGIAVVQAAPPEPIKHALHQAHLESPTLSYTERSNVRIFRFVESFPLQPSAIIQAKLPSDLPREYFYNPSQHWDFDISASTLARLPSIQVRGSRRIRLVNRQSILLRLRCCKSTDNISEWVTQDTDWPSLTNFSINKTRLTPRRKLHNGRDLPIDVSEAVHEGRNTVNFYNARRHEDPLLGYRIAIEMVVQTTDSAILDSVKTIPADTAWQALKRKLSPTSAADDDDDDDELICLDSTLTISLVCIFLQRVWTKPARGAACKHAECFDLKTFLDTRSRRAPNQPSSPDDWRCPLCKGDARPNVLVVDGWLADVRQRLLDEGRLDSVRAIEVDETGEWIAKDGSKRARDGDGSGTVDARDADGQGPAKRPRSEPVVIELD